jgi:hypothetical protein
MWGSNCSQARSFSSARRCFMHNVGLGHCRRAVRTCDDSLSAALCVLTPLDDRMRCSDRIMISSPVDLLKTRMQQGDGAVKLPRCDTRYIITHKGNCLTRISTRSSFILGTAREVISESGIKGLWRGTLPSLVRYASSGRRHLHSTRTHRYLCSLPPS